MDIQNSTNKKIICSALDLFIAQGLRKTSMEEVAHHAGVSRMTIYRYYNNKKDLVRAVMMQTADVFRRISESVTSIIPQNPATIIDLFQKELGELSSISFLGEFDELRRVYPDIYDDYFRIRKDALDSIFEHVITTLKRDGMLREGINETILHHLFFDSIIKAIENTEFSKLNIPRDEILRTIREVFLHGIIGPK